MSKRIAVLTTGGDCSGLNACIRSIVLRAKTYGYEVLGIHQGTTGLIERPFRYQLLSIHDPLDFYLMQAGSFLKSSSKNHPFSYPNILGNREDRSNSLIEAYQELDLSAIICIGGDGSLSMVHKLTQKKTHIASIVIPKTIDNDVCASDYSIGYSTAVDVVTKAIDHIKTTAFSHERVFIIEVMGRDCGDLALASAIAGGVDVVLTPEIPYTLRNVIEHVQKAHKTKGYALVVVSESVQREDGSKVTIDHGDGRIHYGGIGHYISEHIQEATPFETRVSSLGHIQRGGTPCAFDRILAQGFGVYAVDLIHKDLLNQVVVLEHKSITHKPLDEFSLPPCTVERNTMLIETALGLGIYLGDMTPTQKC